MSWNFTSVPPMCLHGMVYSRRATSLSVLYRILTSWVRNLTSTQKCGIVQIFENDITRSKLHPQKKNKQKEFGRCLLPFTSKCMGSLKGGNLSIWVTSSTAMWNYLDLANQFAQIQDIFMWFIAFTVSFLLETHCCHMNIGYSNQDFLWFS
jgi:hypothetical protein